MRRKNWGVALVWSGMVMAQTLMMTCDRVDAEWYVAGFGGVSKNGLLGDTSMPALGDRVAASTFPFTAFNSPQFTRTWTFSSSNVYLKDSPMFGAKAGYFFTDFGFSWLGAEVEAFTTQPKMRKQSVNWTETVTKFDPAQTQPGPDFVPQITTVKGQQAFPETNLRVTTVAANLIARYPGKYFQPYGGIGVGVFYFTTASPLNGSSVVPGLNLLGGAKVFLTESLALFVEYKYNRASVKGLDESTGLKGTYEMTHFAGGVAYHF